MKRQIDIAHFESEAKKADVSVHLLIKRYLNYRITRDHKNCQRNCRYGNPVSHPEQEEVWQCLWVGESKDYFANVDEKHVCDYHDILLKGETCPECNGKRMAWKPFGNRDRVKEYCHTCDGTGMISNKKKE